MTTSLAEPGTDTPTLAPLYADAALEAEVRDVMTPGVVSISNDATLKSALEAIEAHRVHAVLVVGGRTGAPLGWITTRGLLGFVGADLLTPTTEAITEHVCR